MPRGWKDDLSWSAHVFSELAWPILNKIMPGRLEHTELISNVKFAKEMDQLSGIDAWHIIEDVGMRGVASRVQICKPPRRPYNTFTIRKSRDSGTKTEYQKRKEQIESDKGLLYPHLTIQTYVSQKKNGYLRSFGVALTKNIISKIDLWELHGRSGKDVFVKRTSNASFYVIRWTSDLMEFMHGEV